MWLLPPQEDGLDRLAEFRERLVRRVLHVVAREPPQDRLGLGRAQADRRRVLEICRLTRILR